MAQYRLYRVLLPVALLGALAALVAIAGARTQTVGFQLTSLQTFSGDWRGYRGLTGDVNGDGRTDLIWSKTDDGAFNRLVVGLAGADGSFTQGPMSSFAGDWRTYRAYAGDFNGDGLTDLLWNSKCQNSDCSSNANIVVITLSNGDGTFAVQPNQVLGWSGWSQYRTRIGDVDGDGRDDAIFNYVGNGFSDTAPGANFIYAALADSDAVLTLQPLQTVGLTGWDSFNVTIGDVNGDGRSDLIWATQCIIQYFERGESCWIGNNNRLAVGLSAPGGFLVSPPQIIGADGSWGGYEIREGDVNGDGRDDLVWHKPGGDEDNLFFVGLGGQTGTFRVGEQQAVKARGRWSDLSLLDVSGDGAADMVFNSICQARDAGRCTAGRNLLTIGQVDASGGAVFADEQELPAADLERLGLQIRHPAADYNGDGAEDLLWSSMSVHFLGGSSVNTLLAGLALPGEYVSYIPVAMKP